MPEPRLNLYGMQSTGWFLAGLAAIVLALVLIAVLLRYERRLVSRRVGAALLLLRAAVLLVLLAAFLEPTLTWDFDREQRGRILVAFDVSESMDTEDRHATRAEKLRWARALGLIGNASIDARLDRWIASLAKDEEPQFVEEGEAADPEGRRRLEAARRENLARLYQEVDGISRREFARRLLTGTTSPLLEKLQELADVELALFAGDVENVAPDSLEALAAEPPERLRRGVSDLARGLTPQESASAAPLTGIVLLTDGRDTEGRNVLRQASQMGRAGTKICPVVFGSREQPRDLAIGALDFPAKVFKDDSAVLKATLNTSGFVGRELTVVLETDDAGPVTTTVTPAGVEAQVLFELDTGRIGRRTYTLRTEPQEGELRTDNNTRQFAMQVVDDELHALLLEGDARWEFRFIENALERDERVELERIVFEQPYLGVLPEPFFPQELPPPDDGDSSPFSEADLIIIGDVHPDELPERVWEQLEQFVSASGGTLVLVAGKKHLPLAYRSPVLERLLPMTRLRPMHVRGAAAMGTPLDRGFRLRLTPDGEQQEMLHFDPDPVANRRIWATLPGHSWGLFGEAKPGATVLACVADSEEIPNLLGERESAVIVQQPYGFGQVLWIGVDSTWRWRHRVGDLYHHRFWGQLSRWAADNKAASGNQFVRFDVERSEIEVGEEAVLRARWSRAFLNQHRDLKARAEIYRADDQVRARPFSTIELLPDPPRPLSYQGRAASLPEGAWHVRLVADGADLGPDEIAASLYVHPRYTPELADLSAHRQLLAQIAEAGGGRLFDPDELDELPAQFQQTVERTTVRREEVLWDRWYTIAVFFALLAAEWLVRKLNGLP